MAITQPKQQAKAEMFTDKAPDAKLAYRFKGKRRPIAMTCLQKSLAAWQRQRPSVTTAGPR